MAAAAVTHQVVSGALARAAQVAQCDAEDAGAEHAVGVAGEPPAVQRPVERAGVQAVVRAHRTRGGQAGADPKSRVLGVHAGQRWKDGGQKQVVLSLASQQLRAVAPSPASPLGNFTGLPTLATPSTNGHYDIWTCAKTIDSDLLLLTLLLKFDVRPSPCSPPTRGRSRQVSVRGSVLNQSKHAPAHG